ncbi:MAG: ArsI/CadI family heavy metal resistance metalloenzyme [Kiloniellales bacterium]|nr:ArsI/CadI family heavy metal resistance metalloenzyme [Kiloniellales bacterium]
MKRLHVSLGVKDLEASIKFYQTLFGAEPTVRRPGYAKWMLDDPRVNFVLDEKCGTQGVDHMGIQVDEAAELEEVTARLKQAGEDILELEKTQCCFAVSDKSWVTDPQGVDWETFKTHGLTTDYGDARSAAALRQAEADGESMSHVGQVARAGNGAAKEKKGCC